MSEISEKKMFECEKCGIRFEKYEEAVEHEKNCNADETQPEKVEEKPIKFENEEDIIKKIVDEAENETKKQKIEDKELEESEKNVNTDIEQELDNANGIENADENVEEDKEIIAETEIKEEKLQNEDNTEKTEEIAKEIESEAKNVRENVTVAIEPAREERLEAPAPVAQKEEKTKCTLCGLCRLSCPIYSILLNEAASPRGKAIMLKKEMVSNFIYMCTLCKACEKACVLKDIDITKKIVEFRKEMVKHGIRTESNERMIDNIRKYGNAIGKIEPGKKVTLWCC